MTARIYTAAEAEALREAATPRPWRTYGNAAHDDAPSDEWTIAHDGDTLAELRADDRPQYGDEDVAEVVEADADLMAAAPDLAASVAHYARRAERAEADLTVADDRARDAEAESAAAEAALVAVWQAITNDDLPRLPTGDGTVVDAEAVGRRVAEVVAVGDDLNNLVSCQRDTIDELNRECDALRAIIEGRTTPPTDAEIAVHAAAGGRWRCVVPEALRMCADGMHGHAARLHRETLDAAGYTRSSWWATDASARPCAWPIVTEVTQ